MKRTILYFDDESACLKLFGDVFGAEYDVHLASTLSEARRVLAENSPDIVISDQLMPEIRGTDFLREVMETCPGSYRLMLTGGMVLGGVIHEITTGVIHLFIPKPWTIEKMRQALELAALQAESPRERP